MVCSSTSESGKKRRTFGEQKRADDQGKQSLVSEASVTGHSHSSPDPSWLVPLELDRTRLACPKTQSPRSLACSQGTLETANCR